MADKTKVKYYQLELVDSITGGDLEPSFLASLATKAYVDGIKQSLDIKDSVRVAVSTDAPLTPGSATFDGVVIATGERILLMGQTAPEENGIYIFNGVSNPLTRSTDANDADKITLGLYTYTEAGSNAGKAFVLYSVSSQPIVVDTTELLFTQFSGSNIDTTDDLPEGSTNLYFTDVRAQAALASDLATKANVVHTHTTSDITNLSSYTGFDLRYYTETEVDTLLSGKANTSHTHTTADITNLSSYTGFDSRYYTETEVDTLLLGKSDTSHTHTFASLTSKPTTLSGYGITDAYPLTGNPSGFLTTITGIAAGGELSGTYPNPTLTNAAVIGKVLTGLSVTGSTISSTDSIIVAFGKLQNQVDGKAATSHTHAASDVTSGVFNTARLGSGTANSTTYLRGDGTWTTIPTATPGGSTTQIQYNNAGAFAGSANFVWDNTNSRLRLGGGTKVSDLSIISTAAFGDGNLYIESSDATVGASLALNTTASLGRKYLLLSRTSGRFVFYDYTVGADIISIDGAAYNSLAIQGTNTAGSGISMQSTSTGGGIWTLLSTANGNIIGGSKFGIFDGSSYRLVLDTSGRMIIGGTSSSTSAIFQADSTTMGILIPRMTTTNKNAISTPATGLQVFDTTLNTFSFYTGSVWNSIINSSALVSGYIPLSNGTSTLSNSIISEGSGNINIAGNLGIGSGIIPGASAILEVGGTTKGILIPRLDTTQQTAISSPATGLAIFNTTLSNFGFYNGSAWLSVLSNSGLSNTYLPKFNSTTGQFANSSILDNGTQVTIGLPILASDLVGSGTRMVVASATGVLSTQSIPGGISGLTSGYIPIATSSTTLGNSVLYDAGTSYRLVKPYFVIQDTTAGMQFWKDSTPTKAAQIGFNNLSPDGLTFEIYDGSGWGTALAMTGNRSVAIGANSVLASAIFEVVSTTKGVLISRMTTTQQNAISSPATGLTIYNTTLNLNSTYNGSVWTQDWNTRGNNIVSGDYIGSNNNVDLVFKVNSIRAGLINIGNLNTYFGVQSGLNNTGSYNAAFGYNAMGNGTGVGGAAVAVGYASLYALTNGDYNTAVGFYSGPAITTGSSNTLMGAFVGYAITTGSNNTLIGRNAGYTLSTGYGNVVSGYIALNSATTGYYNTVSGSASGYAVTTGAFNTLYGYSSGNNLTTGTGNIAIGQSTDFASTTADYQMNIGNVIFGVGINGTVGSPAGRVGILTNAPTAGYALDVNGDIKAIRINVGTITSTGAATAAIGDSGSITGGSTYSWIMGGFNNTINAGYISSISGGSSNLVYGTNNNVAATISANLPSGTTINSVVGGNNNQIFAGTSTGNHFVGSSNCIVDSNKNYNRMFANGVYATYHGGLYLSDNAAAGGGYLSASADDQFVARFLNGYLFKTANNATRMVIDANGSLGLGTTSIASSAIFEIVSTSKGMLIPRMTTTNRNAISSPATGLMIFNTTTVAFEFFDGSIWTAVGGSGGGGTVTSVGLIGHPMFNIFNSPVTTSGTLDLSIYDQAANTFFAGPSASTGQPTFRAITFEDLPTKPIVDKTANYTVTTSDYTINCTSGTFNVTLLPAVLGLKGRIYVVKNSGAGTITVVPDGSDTIDGGGSIPLSPTDAITVQCTGSAWIII